jgi:gluconokinase
LDGAGAAALSIESVHERFSQAAGRLAYSVDAVCIGSFMHNCMLLDAGDKAVTPVFTWLDRRGENEMEYLRRRLGDDFHRRTGCRFHPMFPIFKLAALYLENPNLLTQARRVASIKTFLTHRLTGEWMEDHGMASASGLYNINSGDWDPTLLGLVGLKPESLPQVSSRARVVGLVTREGEKDFGIAEGTPVINGSGDGFLANIGSDCETTSRISVTLGTSAVARQTLSQPVLDSRSGTFCYRADENVYVLGCAGSNGGNALDWGRSIFGDLEAEAAEDLPIFIPLLHGERSPDWNPRLRGSWHDLTAAHTAADLKRSVVEGVVFNLANYIEIVQRTSRQPASEIVLSGNGFLHRDAAPIFAAVAGVPVWIPSDPGLASLRGAAICALRALDRPVPPLSASRVNPLRDPRIVERYRRYKELRLTTDYTDYLKSVR